MSSEADATHGYHGSSVTRILAVASGCLAFLALSSVHADSFTGQPGYRFVSVQTILGPCCGDVGADLAVDADGTVFVAGKRGGLDLDRDGSVDIQTHGSPDPMIIKARDGDYRKGWVRGPGGPERDTADAIVSDGDGGAYVVGNFSRTMRIGGGTIVSGGEADGFLARYDQHGDTVWVRAIGGDSNDRLFDVASDEAGNVYVIGTIKGPVDVDRNGIIDVIPAGRTAAFLASFDADGNFRWAHATQGEGAALGRSIVAGHQGEIYIGGHYGDGSFDLDGDGTPDGPPTAKPTDAAANTPQADFNSFIARLDSSGAVTWAQFVSGPAMQTVGSLAIGGNGDLLVLGGYNDSTDVDGDGAADLEFRSMGDRKWKHHPDANAFLLRIAPDGKQRWVRRFTAAVAHVSADATRIVVSGSYTGPLDFDDDGTPERYADNDEWLEGFAAILDYQGILKHVFTVVGGDSDVVSAAGFTPDGKKLYITGYTKLGADFSGDNIIESASACHQLGDVYLALYDVEEN